MFDHVVLTVGKLARSVTFYEAALRPFEIKRRRANPRRPRCILRSARKSSDGGRVLQGRDGRGAKDNGPPGPRLHYFPEYYAAYVLDPDGYNIEATYLG